MQVEIYVPYKCCDVCINLSKPCVAALLSSVTHAAPTLSPCCCFCLTPTLHPSATFDPREFIKFREGTIPWTMKLNMCRLSLRPLMTKGGATGWPSAGTVNVSKVRYHDAFPAKAPADQAVSGQRNSLSKPPEPQLPSGSPSRTRTVGGQGLLPEFWPCEDEIMDQIEKEVNKYTERSYALGMLRRKSMLKRD